MLLNKKRTYGGGGFPPFPPPPPCPPMIPPQREEEKSDQGVMDPTSNRNLIREHQIPPQRKFRVGDEGRNFNQELVDLDLRSTFKVMTSK